MDAEVEAELSRLMREAQGGDGDAYERLLTDIAVIARRFVGARAGGASWLEDVVQEVLITVHGARHTYDARRPFGPWLHAIMARRTIDMRRYEGRRSKPLVDGAADVLDAIPAPPPPEPGVPERFRAAIDALPERQRRILHGMKVEGLDAREVAAREGLSVSNVKVIAHRAYNALRAWMERRPRD